MPTQLYDLLNSLDDLDRLIESCQSESETLEYKTAARPLQERDYKEVAKDISAFANSAGGLLIYGIATGTEDKTLPRRREPIAPQIVDFVLQVAATHIRHPVPRMRWKTLPTGEAPEALLLEVPQSALAPHQVLKEHRYYRRHGAHNEPMTHDVLELFFGRRLGPVLEPQVIVDAIDIPPDSAVAAVHLRCRALNTGQRIARNVMILGTTLSSQEIDLTAEGPPDHVFDHVTGIRGASARITRAL